MKSIAQGAFAGCAKLSDISLPASLTSIGSSAFAFCSGLTELTIPEKVTSVGKSAFYTCAKLTSVTLPEGLTSIGDDAFGKCTRLEDVHFNGTEEQRQARESAGWSLSGNELLFEAAWHYAESRGEWKQIDGKWYYYENGTALRYWQQIDGKWYHFNAGGAMDTGWRKIGSEWYYFKDSGVMADDECVTVSGKRYAFAAGGAWRGEQNATFFAAYDYAQQFIKPGMTKAQKLRACFDGLSGFNEKNPWIPHYKGYDWPQKYADYFFANDAGNCFGFAAAFGYLAKAVGYENVYCCNSGGHGWVEIDGLVYDAEWTRHASGNYFGRSLSETGGPKYKTAITRTDSWQYVKL